MSYIQSPLHSHILFLKHLSPHFQTAEQEIQSENVDSYNWCLKTFGPQSLKKIWCNRCGDLINGSTSIYCCEKCGFYIHTSCARSAPLQIEKYYCSMLPEASDGESRLQFAHEHPLTTFPVRTGKTCRVCDLWISEEACGCRECRFFLHEACAKAPLEIQHHPFHPKHPLCLFYDSSGKSGCHACRSLYDRGPIRYRCEECELIFGLSCVISTMPCDDDCPSVIDHPLHPHQLSSYHFKTHTRIRCSFCKHDFRSDDFFGCSDCSFFLHKSCAQPPIDAVQRYLHHEHTLTFSQCPDDEKGHECPICEYQVRSDSYCYTCQTCDLLIHSWCACAVLSDLEKGVAMTVQYPFHEHELKLYCDTQFNFCTVCNRSIHARPPAYKCFSKGCEFKLHKSCLQPPSELEHPSHLLHPLTFCFKPPKKNIACGGCYEEIRNTFAFSCGECKFYLHVDCAQRPTLKHHFHEHHLFYFSEIENNGWANSKQNNCKCRACHKSCRIDFFRCRQCDYTLHYECSQLPPTLKSEHHWEPLVLRESFIEDERAEYYC